MAYKVYVDIIAESELVQTQDKLEMTRVYRVSKIPDTYDTAFKRTAYALTRDEIPGIGTNLGTTDITQHLYVTKRSAKDLGNKRDGEGVVEITVNYSTIDGAADPLNPDEAIWSSTDQLEEKETNVDKDGDEILVSHTVDGVTTTKGALVTRRVPIRTLTARRVEIGIDVEALHDDVAGRVNSGLFLGYAVGRVICTRFSASYRGLINGEKSWDCEYEFQVAPEGYRIIGKDSDGNVVYKSDGGYWNPVAVFVDEEGNPPEGLVPGTGAVEVSLVDGFDFAALNL